MSFIFETKSDNPHVVKMMDMERKISEKTDSISKDYYKEVPSLDMFVVSGEGCCLELAKLSAKYQGLLSREKRQLSYAKVLHDKYHNVARMYWTKDSSFDNDDARKYGYDGANPRMVAKEKIELQLRNDELYVAATLLLAAQQRLVDTLKDHLDGIKNRGFAFRDAIEVMKFKNG